MPEGVLSNPEVEVSSSLLESIPIKTLFLILITMGSLLLALFLSVSHAFWLLWVASIFLCLAFVTVTFPKTWKFLIWLVGIYITAQLSMASFLGLTLLHPIFYGVGLAILFVAAVLTANYIRTVKGHRDRMADRGYVPLGIWSITAMWFLALSCLSAIAWLENVVEAYIIIEILIICSII